MPVKVTSTVGKLGTIPLSDAALMAEIGQMTIRRIHSRTSAGTDVNGASFAPLSAGYAKQRTKQGLGTSSHLTLSGAMLNGMVVADAGPRMVTIGFSSGGGSGASRGTLIQRSRSAGANFKATMAMGDGRVDRLFFDLNAADEQAITDAVERYLDRVIQ